jgi:long-chain acyl-CoA synthetase
MRTHTTARDARYYRNKEETERAFKDGWFCTGDIGERTAQGCVRIIDRRKHIFKLAQGEFVAPERCCHVTNLFLFKGFISR